jgi:hypothetical protein
MHAQQPSRFRYPEQSFHDNSLIPGPSWTQLPLLMGLAAANRCGHRQRHPRPLSQHPRRLQPRLGPRSRRFSTHPLPAPSSALSRRGSLPPPSKPTRSGTLPSPLAAKARRVPSSPAPPGPRRRGPPRRPRRRAPAPARVPSPLVGNHQSTDRVQGQRLRPGCRLDREPVIGQLWHSAVWRPFPARTHHS